MNLALSPVTFSGVSITGLPFTTTPFSLLVTVLPALKVTVLLSSARAGGLSTPTAKPVVLLSVVLPSKVALVPGPEKVVTRKAAEVEPSLDATPRLLVTVLPIT